jgi:hypothetical protein
MASDDDQTPALVQTDGPDPFGQVAVDGLQVTITGGDGDDTVELTDADPWPAVFIGGETDEDEGDLITTKSITDDLIVTYTGEEQGFIQRNGQNAPDDETLEFFEVERISLGAGDDLVDVQTTTNGFVNGGDGFDILQLPDQDGPDGGWESFITEVTLNPDGTESYTGYILFADGSRLDFANFEKIICFTPGTLIDTDQGPRAVETLVPGDRVLTRDHGFRPLVWTGAKDLPAAAIATWPELAPVRIAKGALGQNLPARDLVVSPRHRMLVSGTRAEIMFGEREVLVAAQDLVGLPGISRDGAADTTYLHIMCEGHEILRAEGAWTESFQPAAGVLGALDEDVRAEILRLFPELATTQGQSRFAAARPVLSSAEARLLIA